jgi:hypothetical protein
MYCKNEKFIQQPINANSVLRRYRHWFCPATGATHRWSHQGYVYSSSLDPLFAQNKSLQLVFSNNHRHDSALWLGHIASPCNFLISRAR